MNSFPTRNPRLAGLALAAALLAAPAHAVLVEQDLETPGDGKVTLDTATNLLWLDLNLSVPLAINQVGAFVADGWSVASLAQVQTLVGNHFGSSTSNGSRVPVDPAAARAFVDLLGPTFSTDVSWGRFQSGTPGWASQAIVRFDTGLESYLISNDAFRVSEPHIFSGVFLVRAVPEPGTYALMLGGLGLLGALARRKANRGAQSNGS